MDKKIEELIVQFKELISSGKEKCSDKNYGEAYDDFEKAFEIAKTINGEVENVNILIEAYNNLATSLILFTIIFKLSNCINSAFLIHNK